MTSPGELDRIGALVFEQGSMLPDETLAEQSREGSTR